MNKLIVLMSVLGLCLHAIEIPTQHASSQAFGKSVAINSQVIQLSNASQSVMSLVSGHIEKYYVKAGEKIKKGDKIVLLESIAISKMTAEFISQKKQLSSVNKNYKALQNLYKKGMTSLQSLNKQSIQKDELLAKLSALKSQLKTLNINTDGLRKATSNFIIYAHSDGVVAKILQPLHSGVGVDTPIISLVKEQAYYLKSFLPLAYASKVKVGQKLTIDLDGKIIVSHVTQILPKVDVQTQRIVLLSSVDEKTDLLYINAYIASTLYFDDAKNYVAVRTSALSFYKNEWVVFLPKEEAHEEEHDEHEGHGHDEHEEVGHDEHEEEEAKYEIRVVKIVAQDEKFIGVEGLREGEEYVSAKSYYVKSMLLKSSLGGHGH
ncbi:efflux RND transporter periplasmic adaptor subunit [Sulfurimonas sp. SAG-AH-194-I05]|nr:efflux RND transporter periplasmic adaptor subunit [Sulfurimonas sp. SAG-AH-194-I05]MDF1875618.1 efflux RND transporter periplasmic adaptor subunit [Sulfurimonas sp. SAG-AH-194-I05]